MSFSQLYDFAAEQRSAPIIIEGLLDQKIIDITAQDEIFYTAVELDDKISLGHIKQTRIPKGVYDRDPNWVTQIRYSNKLNVCWQRIVCCKELMHIFDSPEECVNNEEKFAKLLAELESPPLSADASPMFLSEQKTKWMALAVLCPLPFRDYFLPLWENGDLSTYDVALALRIPEVAVPSIMGEYFPEVVGELT